MIFVCAIMDPIYSSEGDLTRKLGIHTEESGQLKNSIDSIREADSNMDIAGRPEDEVRKFKLE